MAEKITKNMLSPFFKFQLQPNGKYRKVHLTYEEVLQIFSGQSPALVNVIKKYIHTGD